MAIRLGGALKELRIHLCQTSKSSQGIREWLEKNYVNIKKDNPAFPILVRECNGIQPRIWARYEKGIESSVALTDKNAADVTATLKTLIN